MAKYLMALGITDFSRLLIFIFIIFYHRNNLNPHFVDPAAVHLGILQV